MIHFRYRRTIRLKQENFSCNYTRRHKRITHKNNCCQVFSRSCNDQLLFVNEYKVKIGWQYCCLRWRTSFLDFAEQNIENIFQANLNHTPRLLIIRTCEYFHFKWTLRPFYNNIFVWLGTVIHSDKYRLSTRNVLQNSTCAARYLGAKAYAPQFPGSTVFVLKAASNVNVY